MESPVRKQDLQTVPELDDQDGNEDHNSDKEECDVREICRDECECEIDASVGISEVQVRKSEEDPREVKAILTAEDEALHWLQAVTGKTIENDNVRDALQDGVLLCELINILHPGCVWKIDRGASPIAGLDNLGAFLRGCASLGLRVSQLFDPGDLQDPTTRHTLTSSEANRSVKNVLVTIYWLGRAASKLPEYHGAPLNRKAFATLLAQSEETDETDSVLGSSWELEQSDTPSPHSCPQSHSDSLRPHDPVCCSLDKLEIIGGEVESPATKMPDIQKDDMATRRTSAMADQPRPAAPFNQFLPGQHNLTTGVLPGQPTVSQSNTGSQNHLTSPLVVSMSEVQQPAQLPIQQGKVDRFQVTEQKIQPRDLSWDSEDEERLGEPDVEKDDLAARRGWQGNRTPAVPHNRFLPAHSDSRDVLRWENMVQSAQRLRDQAMLQIGHRGRKHDPAVLPDTDRDDLARRRVGQSLPGRPQQVQAALCGPVSTSDLHTWQRLQIVCEGDREKVQSSDAVSTTELAPTPPRPASASALQPSSPFGLPARPQYMILGGMTEGDLLRWQKLRIAGDDKEEDEEDVGRKEDQLVVAGDAPPLASNAEQTSHHGIPSVKAVCTESQTNDMVTRRLMRPYVVSTKQSQPFLPSHCAEEDQQRWQAISAALRRREQEHEEKREAAKGNDGDIEKLLSKNAEKKSTSLIGLESEPGRLPGLSTYRRRESASAAEVESWQEDFARWKSRRQRASRELWKRKEEREMAEQAHASVGTRLLGTKTYREILEEKQRREQVLQNAYRQARNAGDAAAVLARYREQFLQDFAGERYELPEFLQQDLSLELEGLGLRSTQAPGLLRQLSEPPISTATPLLNAFSASSGFGNFSTGTRMAVSAQTCRLSQMTETAVSSLIPVPETPSVPTTPTTSQAPLNKISTSTSSVFPANVTNASSLTPPLNTSGSTLQSTGVKNPSNPPFKSFSLDHDSQLVSPALHLFPLPADSPPSPAPLSPSRTRLVPIVVPRPYKSQSSKLHSLLNFTILDADIDKNGTSCGRPGVLSDEKRTDFSPVMEEKKTTVGMDELALGNRHGGWDPEKQRRRLEHWQKQQQKHLEKQFERQQERLQKHWEQVQLGVEIQEQKHREEEIEILAKTAMPSIRSVGEGSAMPSSPSSLSENYSHLRILEEEPEVQCNYLKTDFDLVEGTGRRNGEPSVQTEDYDLDLEGSSVEGKPESRLAEKSSALPHGPAVQTGKMLIGHQLCATCAQPVVKGPAMVIKALDLCFHVNCFKCDVCGQPLAPCNEGTDVRLQDGNLRCKTCDVDSNIEVARTSTV